MNIDFYETLFEQEFVDNQDNIITERSIINDERHNFSVHSTPDAKHNLGEPAGYFKWVEGKKLNINPKDIVRIKFSEPVYIKHDGSTKVLKKGQKDDLIAALQSPISDRHFNNLPKEFKEVIETEWQYLIYMYNIDCHVNTKLLLDHLDIEEPFSELPDDKMVRLNLPIPDYTKLREEKKK